MESAATSEGKQAFVISQVRTAQGIVVIVDDIRPGMGHKREKYGQQCFVPINHQAVGAGAAQSDQGPGKRDAQKRRTCRSQVANQGIGKPLQAGFGWRHRVNIPVF